MKDFSNGIRTLGDAMAAAISAQVTKDAQERKAAETQKPAPPGP